MVFVLKMDMMARGSGRYNDMDADIFKWIIGGMAFGYVAIATYIVKLHLEIKELNAARIKWLKDQLKAMGDDA